MDNNITIYTQPKSQSPCMQRGLGCSCGCGNSHGLGDSYNAAEIVGKSLVAKMNVPVKSGGYDNSPVIRTAKPGETIGVVYSYLNPKEGRSVLNWILDVNGQYQYVAHKIGAFDVTSLKYQGAESVEDQYKEKQEQEQRENDPVGYYLKKYGLPALLIVGGIIVTKEAVESFISRKKPAPAA